MCAVGTALRMVFEEKCVLHSKCVCGTDHACMLATLPFWARLSQCDTHAVCAVRSMHAAHALVNFKNNTGDAKLP